MPRLPFDSVPWKDERKGYDERVAHVKEEKDMDEYAIRDILRKRLEDEHFLTKSEKNFKSENVAPFDLIAGIPDTLELTGFEIKADTDTFARLSRQLRYYYFVFDAVYLVVHKKVVPEWLPESVGVIRVFENGDAFMESHAMESFSDFEIGSKYEWDTIFRENGLGTSWERTQATLKNIKEIRNNILFNRFFAEMDGYGTHRYSKFYPFTEAQKKIIMGFDLPYHYDILVKDIGSLEKKFNIIKEMLRLASAPADKNKQEKLKA